MREILRTNDQVFLSYAEMVLRDAGFNPVVFDNYTSILEGSVMAIQRRLMVLDDEEDEALQLLKTMKKDYDSTHG